MPTRGWNEYTQLSRQLKQAGLVTVRREGRSLIYAANVAAMSSVMAYLTKNCCGGDLSRCVPASGKRLAAAGMRARSARAR